jgi:LytS/YehU family sensor histidine kinase
MEPSALTLEEARRIAHREMKERRGLYQGLIAYAIIIPSLWAINLATGSKVLWAQWPMLGWGAALLGHAATVFAGRSFFGADWERRKVAELVARENLRIVSNEKQAVQAQLRLLQAQIEPHFLFNTLATVQTQIKRSPESASTMLEHLIGYLRQSLTASRAEQGTLAQEFDRLRDYLALLKMRMGERLQTTLTLDPALADHPFAPMLLQPLVENAIRHGLEPKVEGGSLSLSAAPLAGGERWRITLTDTGLGFGAHPDSAGTGLGLSHVRERLALLYDGRAELSVADAAPGTRITIDLPLH